MHLLRNATGFAIAVLVVACSATTRPAGPRLYVSNEMGGDVAVVDPATRAVTSRIAVGKRPRGIHASPDGRSVYVALSGSPIGGPGVDESVLPPPDKRYDGIGVIDVEHGRLVRTLPGGSDPEQFAVSRDGSRLFISNEDAGTLSVLDVPTAAVVETITVGAEPEGVDLTPDGRFAYVTSESEGTISIVDTTALTMAGTVAVGPRPRSTGFLPDGTRAYVSSENGRAVYVIDAPRHALLSKVELSGATWKPMGVATSPDSHLVFVTTGRGGALVVLDASDNHEIGWVAVGERPWGLAVSPDGRTVYTANGTSNDVSVVDVASRTVAARIATGDRPWGVALASASTGQSVR